MKKAITLSIMLCILLSMLSGCMNRSVIPLSEFFTSKSSAQFESDIAETNAPPEETPEELFYTVAYDLLQRLNYVADETYSYWYDDVYNDVYDSVDDALEHAFDVTEEERGMIEGGTIILKEICRDIKDGELGEEAKAVVNTKYGHTQQILLRKENQSSQFNAKKHCKIENFSSKPLEISSRICYNKGTIK